MHHLPRGTFFSCSIRSASPTFHKLQASSCYLTESKMNSNKMRDSGASGASGASGDWENNSSPSQAPWHGGRGGGGGGAGPPDFCGKNNKFSKVHFQN